MALLLMLLAVSLFGAAAQGPADCTLRTEAVHSVRYNVRSSVLFSASSALLLRLSLARLRRLQRLPSLLSPLSSLLLAQRPLSSLLSPPPFSPRSLCLLYTSPSPRDRG